MIRLWAFDVLDLKACRLGTSATAGARPAIVRGARAPLHRRRARARIDPSARRACSHSALEAKRRGRSFKRATDSLRRLSSERTSASVKSSRSARPLLCWGWTARTCSSSARASVLRPLAARSLASRSWAIASAVEVAADRIVAPARATTRPYSSSALRGLPNLVICLGKSEPERHALAILQRLRT